MNTEALRIEGLTKAFGGLKVFNGISFGVQPGEVLGVIGPNGAGKTTLVNVVCGLIPQTDGKVWLGARDITAMPFHAISRLGVLRSFQQTNTFRSATVEENLYRARRFSQGQEIDLEPLVRDFDLARHMDEESGSLPYGKQKMLGLLMALAPRPRFLLMDEPAAGLERSERGQIDRFISFAQQVLQCGIVIIEHDMDLVKRLCPRILVLESGRILAEGAPADVLSQKAVMDAYLGSDGDE
ncbi:MAG: ABC transporter ATP-binding protein [Paracoccus sp. BP8]|uniref:ABC transporter ATP-binding protein n=1 Tax=Paracoccus sp. J39 TaxID=935848 RepID=UPI0004911CD2|nr:ABC transporter ATP-binding protein [Paracoccus sp. J39]RQP04157.1 MAG: ABC transporter ATP-binding protein [Paracoccus sp. BP8]